MLHAFFPTGYMWGTRRSTTRFTHVTIVEPVGYTQHATRVENQHPCSQQKSLFCRLMGKPWSTASLAIEASIDVGMSADMIVVFFDCTRMLDRSWLQLSLYLWLLWTLQPSWPTSLKFAVTFTPVGNTHVAFTFHVSWTVYKSLSN